MGIEMKTRLPVTAVALLALSLLSACGKERREEAERERAALADSVAEIQAVQLRLLLPKAVPRFVPPQHLPLLVHGESVQDLHERNEMYVDLKEEDMEEIRNDIAEMEQVLALKAETDRVRALPWRKP
jgi:hypothetical protein